MVLFLRDRYDGDEDEGGNRSGGGGGGGGGEMKRPPSYSTLLHAACQVQV